MHVIHMLICFIYLKHIWISNIIVWRVNSMVGHQWLCKSIHVLFGWIVNNCIIIFICYYNGSCNKYTWVWKECILWTRCNWQNLYEGGMELVRKLASNNKSNIWMHPSAPKDVSVIYSYQCINVINNKDRLNGQGSTNI